MTRATTSTTILLLALVACGGEAGNEDDDGTGGTTGQGAAGTGGDPSTGVGGDPSTGTGGDATSSTSSSTSTSASTSTGVGGMECMPDCSNTECGPDPVCGTDCGSCSGQDACMNGQCVCEPACSGLECGPDGCGGTCGTCSTGQCTSGQCVVECQPSQTECHANLTQIDTCNNGLWQTQSCPQYSVCVQGGCQPVCDGHLATQINPSTCFFPVKEGANNGLFMYTNDNTKLTLVSKVDGNVWDTVNAAAIYTANGTAWPWAWSMFGGSQADVAVAQFKLTGFNPPAQTVWIHFRAHRTGLIQTSWPSRYNIAASNGSIFASAQLYANYTWTNHSVNVSSPYVEQFSASNWNFMMMSPIGDGFAHPADHTELSWYMLEVVD